jgi:hypothetical protein
MDIVEDLRCQCNDKVYTTRAGLNQHRRTKGHLEWQKTVDLREALCRCKRLENENEGLKYDLVMYRKRIQELEACMINE